MSACPLVTVLVPAYNAAPYLRESLESILAQDYRDIELLLIDDGSTDDTAAVLATVDDPRLRVVRQDNTGLVGALNRGLDEARGDYLARMDADDIMPPGRLSAQVRAMDADPGLVVCGTDYEMFGAISGRVRMPRTDAACRQRLLLATSHCGASVMLRSSVLQRSGIRFRPDFAHAEDYRFFTELAAYGRAANLPIVGYRYRMHPHQVSAVYSAEQRAAHLRIAREFAVAEGVTPLSEEEIERLLWGPRPDGSFPVALVRQLAGVAVPATKALVRRPGTETVRFVGLKIVEAAARVRQG